MRSKCICSSGIRNFEKLKFIWC